MTTFIERLLQLYNLSFDDFKYMTRNVSKKDLESCHNFKNIEIAKKRILKAIDNNEKIMIYGDYDCDGITSTSILKYTFDKLNFPVGYYIPSRYLDGYGINEEKVNQIHEKGYTLIITVDNGIVQYDALKKAKEYGIDVILTDHHEPKEIFPENYTIVHPFFKEDNTTLPECGAYVALNLSEALLGYKDEYLITLGALATLSDMMPLRGYNRDIVRVGIDLARKNNYQQFELLTNHKGIEDEKSFSYTCAPRINSLGRVLENTKVNKGVVFFTSTNQDQILDAYRFIEYSNDRRKVISNDAFSKIDLTKYKNDIFVIDCFYEVNEGLIGLIANKVLMEANKPCIIFTKDKKTGFLKGSARSLPGLPLSELFSQLQDIIIQFGGHAMAGGVSLIEENLPVFIQRVNEIAKNYKIQKKEKKIIQCDLNELNQENYSLIKSLSPYGEEFEEPYIQIDFPCKNISYLSNGKHMKGTINEKCSFIAFNVNKDYGKQGELTLIGKLNKDSFKGGDFLSLVVEEISTK